MSVVFPTKYKNEQKEDQPKKVIPTRSMEKDFNKPVVNKTMDCSEIKPTSPYPPNRRKPGVTLPILGRLPYRVMLNENCPDLEKEAVKSMKEVDGSVERVKSKGKKGKKGKKK